MLLEEIANLQLYSYLPNLTLFLPNKLHYEGTSDDHHGHNATASLTIFVIWTIMYLIYKKFLDLMLRRMRYPLIQRNRLIDGLWCFAFSVCSMTLLVYVVPETRNFSCPWQRTGDHHLGVLIHKAFYLHRATIEVFAHNCWLTGWTSQLFALSVTTPSSQEWPQALAVLLFYKAMDMGFLNICKILLTLSRSKITERAVKFIFILHFINWIYIHIFLVPSSLYTDPNRNWRTQSCLWTWLICEILNSVRYKEFGCIYSKQYLESSLFPRPSQEAVEFVNILKRHRNSVNNNKVAHEASAQQKKTELWQTIFCAMTMKKKLKKLREAKRAMQQETSHSNQIVKKIYKHS